MKFRDVRITPSSDSESLNNLHRPDHLTRSNLKSLLSGETLAFKSVLAGSMYFEGIINFSTGGVTPGAGGVLFTGPVTVTRYVPGITPLPNRNLPPSFNSAIAASPVDEDEKLTVP